MSPVPSLCRVVSKTPPSMALHCLKSLSSRPLASTRLVQNRSCKARSFSSATTIPIVGSEHQSDIPSVRVLSRLNIFGLWRDMPDIDVERKQELARRAQEAQRQEREEAQKKNKSDITIDPYPIADGGGGRTADDQIQYEGHGSEGADTWTGTDVSIPDYNGGCCGGYDCGGCGGGGTVEEEAVVMADHGI